MPYLRGEAVADRVHVVGGGCGVHEALGVAGEAVPGAVGRAGVGGGGQAALVHGGGRQRLRPVHGAAAVCGDTGTPWAGIPPGKSRNPTGKPNNPMETPGKPNNPMETPWKPHGNPMETPWNTQETPRKTQEPHGKRQGNPHGNPHENPQGTPLENPGIPREPPPGTQEWQLGHPRTQQLSTFWGEISGFSLCFLPKTEVVNSLVKAKGSWN